MSNSFHMPLLRVLFHIIFIIFSLTITWWLLLLRIFNIVFKRKKQFINPFKYIHQDVFKEKYQVIKVQGFQIVEFQGKTKDNANVCLWRIIPERKNKEVNKMKNSIDQQKSPFKKPILIQHGLLDCSMSWFFHKQLLKTLPYMLANQGYDVWLGNNRGSRFSLCGNQSDQKYWDYSLDQLAQYDIPCLIEYILKTTGSDKLIYIGHSQGSTQLLTAIDINPEIGDKIELFFGLGPLISMAYLENHLLLKVLDKLRIVEILRWIGFKSVCCIPIWVSKVSGFLIYNSRIFCKGIHCIVRSLCGTNREKIKINLQRLGIIMSHQPGGSSINNVYHWIQIYRSGRMHRFDYGSQLNLKRYGERRPPEYRHEILKEVDFEFHLFRGQADGVISDGDWEYLVGKIREEKVRVYQLEDYAHLDYVWCEDAYEDIYLKILGAVERNREEEGEEIDEKINGSLSNTNDSQTENIIKSE